MRLNITANFLGQAIASGIGLLCVPIYLRLLGAEAIGLIGFSLGLQAVLRVVDMGISPAVMRQMARLGGQPERAEELADFLCTFERIFIGAALFFGSVTVALSPLIATRWLQSEHFATRQLTTAVAFIGLQCSSYFVSMLYQGVLVGLERQLSFNVLKAAEAVLSQFGAVLLLTVWSARVEVMFGWQLAASIAVVLAYRLAVRVALRAPRPGRFQLSQIRAVSTFALGMAAITATGTLLANMDKLLLSKWLKLENFGHYTLGCYSAMLMAALLGVPVYNAFFPRYCALAERPDEREQRTLHHLALQSLVTLVWPVAAILWVFPAELMRIWISDSGAINAAAEVVPFLAAGIALNVLAVPAYMLQLSRAWTSMAVKLNLGLLAVFGPLLYLLTVRWGLVGAAVNFALMQGVYLLVGTPLTHRRLLRERPLEFLVRDVLPGASLCVLAAAALAAMRPALTVAAPWLSYGAIGCGWGALAVATALVSGRLRAALQRIFAAGAAQPR